MEKKNPKGTIFPNWSSHRARPRGKNWARRFVPGEKDWASRFAPRENKLGPFRQKQFPLDTRLRNYESKSSFPFDKSNFPLAQDFLSLVVRCGALALVPMGGEKIHRNCVSKSNFPFDRSNFPLTQDFLSRAVRCGAFAFVPGFFFPPPG